jgi:hypothetical protein
MMTDSGQPVRYYDENGEPHDVIVFETNWLEEADDAVAPDMAVDR